MIVLIASIACFTWCLFCILSWWISPRAAMLIISVTALSALAGYAEGHRHQLSIHGGTLK